MDGFFHKGSPQVPPVLHRTTFKALAALGGRLHNEECCEPLSAEKFNSEALSEAYTLASVK